MDGAEVAEVSPFNLENGNSSMKAQKIIPWINLVILIYLCLLVFYLPIAHTETIRAFAFGIPSALWFFKMILQKRLLFKRTPLDIPIMLCTAAAALSLTTAVDFRYSLEEFLGEWVLGISLFYLLVNNFQEERLKYFFGALLLGNLVMVVYGNYDFFRQGGSLVDYQVRASALHYIAGALATYLVTVLPYLLLAAFFHPHLGARLLLFFLVLFNYFTLYLTHVRGAWIPAVLIGLFICGKFYSKKAVLILVAAGALFIFFIAPEKILIHHAPWEAQESPAGKIDTGQARWEVWKFSLEKIREHPFQMLGFGRRSFVKQYGEFYEKYKGALLWHAHNTFLNLSLQTGVQGLVFFIFLVYKLLRFTYQRAESEKDPLKKAFVFAAFFMVISFFLRNMADDFFADDGALLFWMLSGAAVSLQGDKNI